MGSILSGWNNSEGLALVISHPIFHGLAGVLVHVSNFHNPSLLPLILANSVPIWYYWGQWSGKPLHTELKTVQQYCPTRKEIEAVIARPGQPATGSDENAVTPSTAPKPQVCSRQRQGETWQDFFKRQDARHAELEKNESLAKIQKWLDHERSHNNMAPTGRKGKVVVYAWIKENGFRVFEDEWDLCTEFDPEAREQFMYEDFFTDYEETSGGYDRQDGPQVEKPPPFKLCNLPLPPSRNSWGDDLMRAYGTGDPNDEVKVVGATEPLLDILHTWFGFTLDISKFPYQKITDPTLQHMPWGDVRRNLANTESSIGDEYKDAIGDFTDLLLVDCDPPGSIWDLSPLCPWPLLEKLTSQDLVFELVNNEPYYFLNNSVRGIWQIMTRDAASALQCLRVCKHHREDLACYLLNRGILFTTRIPSSIPFIC
ncbi:hypothetical protein BU17DRAFT_79387 [Hysterangium stoloniferum]|nr:hypothetical protein BU17DRAFT_79387 [Hysterangium stoloniferum]